MQALAHAPRGKVLQRDLGLALVLSVLVVIGSRISLPDDDPEIQAPGWGSQLLLVLAALSLTFRGVAPVLVLVLNLAASLGYEVLGHRPEVLPLGVIVALYTVAARRRPLIFGAAAVFYVLALVVGASTGLLLLTDDLFFSYVVSVAAAGTVGYGVALSRARASLAERRNGELAREQDARTRAAVEQEQARIAREVHDIVAHDLSVIVAQAAAARRVLDRRPETARNVLASVEAVGRDALDGLRRLVGLLRTEGLRSERAPQPTLERLPWLLAQVERAGLPVQLTIRGQPRPLPATVELNAFRIVQEALTNTLKHAGPTRATVTLEYGDESLGIEVRDGGRGDRAAATAGYGLISMRQRVTMLGGHLVTGSNGGPGFRVSARLPVGMGTS